MTCKSILTYVDGEEDGDGRRAGALKLARRFDAHLTVLALGYEPDLPAYAYGEAPSLAMTQWYDESRARAEELAKSAGEWLESEGVRGDAMPLTATYAGVGAAFGARARFADLVVLGRPYGEDNEQSAVNLLEGALFDGDAAVMVCPPEMPEKAGTTVLIGWNGDREALRAVRRATPFLSEADKIEIAVVDPDGGEANPGEDLAVMLSRHGLPVEVAVLASAGQGVTATLERRATEIGADLMVMGAYGHSRFRELVLGGVTRDILRATRIPVLMAH